MTHLSKSVVDSWFEQQKQLSDLTHNTIYKRLEEVVMTIGKCFGINLEDHWCLKIPTHYALCESSCEKSMMINLDYSFNERQQAILSDGQIFDLHHLSYADEVEIPTRWLYEDFEQELKDGIKKFQLEFDAQESQRLQDSIKNKLTKKELELISFK